MSENKVADSFLSEAEVIRRTNVSQRRAVRLRAAGILVPDLLLGGGRLRLYNRARLSELDAKINPPVAALVGHSSQLPT